MGADRQELYKCYLHSQCHSPSTTHKPKTNSTANDAAHTFSTEFCCMSHFHKDRSLIENQYKMARSSISEGPVPITHPQALVVKLKSFWLIVYY